MPALVEIAPPDLSQWQADYDGPAFTIIRKGPRPGPWLTLVAIIHGNEFAGAIALDRLLRAGLSPLRGTLCVIFANPAAMAQFEPGYPWASRFVDEDLNRVWSSRSLGLPPESREAARAQALLPLINRTDHLLDLHSMHSDGPPLLLTGISERACRLAADLGAPFDIVRDPGHRLGRRLIDHDRFTDADAGSDGPTALLAECGHHWRARTVGRALDLALRWLCHFGAVSPAWAARFGTGQGTTANRIIEVTDVVTVDSDERFRFTDRFRSLDIIPQEGSVIAMNGQRPVRTPYPDCVLIMPAEHCAAGHTAVRLGRIVAP